MRKAFQMVCLAATMIAGLGAGAPLYADASPSSTSTAGSGMMKDDGGMKGMMNMMGQMSQMMETCNKMMQSSMQPPIQPQTPAQPPQKQ